MGKVIQFPGFKKSPETEAPVETPDSSQEAASTQPPLDLKEVVEKARPRGDMGRGFTAPEVRVVGTSEDVEKCEAALRVAQHAMEAAMMAVYEEADGGQVYVNLNAAGVTGVPSTHITSHPSGVRTVVLNIGMSAVQTHGPLLHVDADPLRSAMQFSCRFNMKAANVKISIDSILSIYVRSKPGIGTPPELSAAIIRLTQTLKSLKEGLASP